MAERPRKENNEVVTDKTCVFALDNQKGKMKEMIGNQKYCMVIQNTCFEASQHVQEHDGTGYFIDQELWNKYEYDDVCTIPKHSCEGCAFYLPVEEFKLVPSKLKVRYAWTVERR